MKLQPNMEFDTSACFVKNQWYSFQGCKNHGTVAPVVLTHWSWIRHRSNGMSRSNGKWFLITILSALKNMKELKWFVQPFLRNCIFKFLVKMPTVSTLFCSSLSSWSKIMRHQGPIMYDYDNTYINSMWWVVNGVKFSLTRLWRQD